MSWLINGGDAEPASSPPRSPFGGRIVRDSVLLVVVFMRGAPGGREARTASSPPSSSLVDMTNETRCEGRKV